MFNGMRVVAVTVAAVAVVSISAFFYLTREIAAPSVDVQDTVQQLETSTDGDSAIIFRIAQDESQVQYVINEVLNGADKTVIGATTEVAGDILLNLGDLSQSQISEISINARTFATDDDRRDNSVARFILQSESATNEFITFQPTNITGLPNTGNVGDLLNFQITGDLTIVGVTNSVTFETSATLESESRLVGSAEATVLYADFGLSIPNVPFVASVDDNVVLKLNFVATAVTEA